jgi:hypothetical protein
MLWAGPLCGQNSNAIITGTVTDQSAGAIPNAQLTLIQATGGAARHATSGPDGNYSFPNLSSGTYRLQCSAPGFQSFIQQGIILHLNESASVPIQLKVGSTNQTVEVSANASPLNFQNAAVEQGISTEAISALPLEVAGAQRCAINFETIMPGVTATDYTDVGYAMFNGGQWDADEGILDGVSMVEGMVSQSGTVSMQGDYPISPEAIGEVSLLTSNYDPQYGSTNSAVTVASTKSGTDQFHGGGYEFNRNTDFNARQFGVAERPIDIENDAGAFIGGPFRAPLFWSGRKKTYFFVNFEAYRSRGATTKPILTVPTALEREGDFSEWPYPIYDPDTTTVNPDYDPNGPASATNIPYLRQQFMGCDGSQPNVICPTDPRLANSLASGWIKYVPPPNRPGLVSNYEAPKALANSGNSNTDQWDVRVDQNIGDKDHLFVTWHYRGGLPFTQSALPPQIDTNNTRIPNYGELGRLNYDHTFSPTLLNHFAIGYLDLKTGLYNSSDCCVSQVPQIEGVYDHYHESALNFEDGFSPYGGNQDGWSTRPTWVANDMVTWLKGKHMFEFGGEYRDLALPLHGTSNGSGTFNFSDANTGLLDFPSPTGNSYASFLLGYVGSASVSYYSLSAWRSQAKAIGFFAGDTWKPIHKLSVNYGIRWDLYQPSEEAKDQASFFDPTKPNPGAGNLPGALVFAGNKWGSASFGKPYPEQLYHRAFGPRIGVAYGITNKTVARAGFGVFYMQAFYPGWGGGIATDGFNETVAFNSALGGIQPAFLLQDGVPQNFQKPPFINSSYLNGENAPNYRPFDANQLPHAYQWNVSAQHQFTDNFHVNVAYVANHGSRLMSQLDPANALNPSLLSMGGSLFDQFAPDQATLDGVNQPYAGWAGQMQACAPSVAQALVPFPQYCGNIFGLNENHGWSNYQALQLSAEHRLSHGLWLLADYTFSKTLTTSDFVQASSMPTDISPFQKQRNYGLAEFDIPQILNLSFAYDLPFGKGHHWLNQSGVVNRLVGGWQVSTVLRLQSGQPFQFYSSTCNVPSQFAAGCVPGMLPGANPYATGKSGFDPNSGLNPLLSATAFQPVSTFNFNLGEGTRVSNVRGFGYHSEDIALTDNIPLTERFRAQIRAEFFDAWNWHSFLGTPFVNDIASPSFGDWNGGVSSPRNIQLGVRFSF